MIITPDINLGNVLVTSAIAVVGLGVRRLYTLVKDAIDRQELALEDIDDHAEVLNLHSNLFVEAGLVKGPIGLPRVEERRKRTRVYTGHTI